MKYLPESRVNNWAKWALLNLVIVASLGVLLRYKMLFSLPSVHYKNLLHGHSHFAFAGWVSTALFVAIARVLQKKSGLLSSIYYKIFILFQVSSFGMLVTFPVQGYALWSICFSTLSILTSYLFCWIGWKDISRSALHTTVKYLFKTALFFFFLSSLGAFALAYMMAVKVNDPAKMLSGAYFFLHFQYNGWFLFALMGLFLQKLIDWYAPEAPVSGIMPAFRLLAFSVVPGYLLSLLWMRVPTWVQILAGLAGVLQLAAAGVILAKLMRPVRVIWRQFTRVARILWLMAISAFVIKVILQALSAVPSLSLISFAYRPVVIGYLHLVLLAFVSLFLLGYFLEERLFSLHTGTAKWGLAGFVSGVILNEVFLMIQGIGVLSNTGIPGMNHLLLGVVSLIFAGIAVFYSQQVSYRPYLNLPA